MAASPSLAPHQHLQSHLSNPSLSQHNRLPSVTLPPEDFLEPPHTFDGGRRQSINSDPILHAFSSDSTQQHPPTSAAVDQSQNYHLHASTRSSTDADAGPSSLSLHVPPQGDQGGMRPGSPGDAHGGMGNGGGNGGGGNEQQYGQQYSGSGFAQQQGHSFNPSVGPAPTYRFGGGPGGPPQPQGPLDAPSYFDYSMRRHSLSINPNGTASPPRQLHGGGVGDAPAPSPGLKRKTSGDAEYVEDEGYINAVRYGQQNGIGAAPNPKRRTSSLTFEKLSNMNINEEQARRESYHQSQGPWEEDRRGSGGSYASSHSQGYYPSAPPTGYQQQQHQQQAPPSHFAHHQQHQSGPPWGGPEVGPRGSISRGPYEDSAAFQRRPSIPSVTQMMQGQTAYYSAPPPVPPPHSNPHAPQAYPTHSRGLTGPAVMVSSIPPPGAEIDEAHSRTASSASYASIPPPPPGIVPWARPAPSNAPQRQNSASSLDPSSAYGPGGSKDSPYSRSPELRVSHKLAERKRRKEMAQLFEDLRESLPFDRGLKASKWEILSKAIDYVAEVKDYAAQLQQENQSIRAHYSLGPNPVSPPDNLVPSNGYQRPPPGSSHGPSHLHQSSSSHEASPAPPGTAGNGPPPPFQQGTAPSHSNQPWIPSAPSPSNSNVSRPNTAQPPPQQSPLSSTFPPQKSSQQPHQQHQFAYAPPHPNGAQPSPPLSQRGAGSPKLQLDQPGAGSPVTSAGAHQQHQQQLQHQQ